jgi:hypothetical protein
VLGWRQQGSALGEQRPEHQVQLGEQALQAAVLLLGVRAVAVARSGHVCRLTECFDARASASGVMGLFFGPTSGEDMGYGGGLLSAQ